MARTIDEEMDFTYQVLGPDVQVWFRPYGGHGYECIITRNGERLGRGVGDTQEALQWARIAAVANS